MAHPTFDTAGEDYRWQGPLEALWGRLKQDAYRAEGEWVYRVLRHGACVWLRILPNFTKELLITRPGHPKDGDLGAWESEVATFLAHFETPRPLHCTEFGPVIEPDGSLVTFARFVEHFAAAAPPAQTEVDWEEHGPA